MKYQHQLALLLIFTIFISFSQYVLNSHNHVRNKSKNKNHHKIGIKSKQEPGRLPKNIEVLYQGWGYYFHEINTVTKSPKNLFQNNEYFGQRVLAGNKNQKDKHGNLSIPTRSSFYSVIYKDAISFYSARSKIERHNVDTLLIRNISPIPEDSLKDGGVTDLGKIKDYYCLRIKTIVPQSWTDPKEVSSGNKSVITDREFWLLCYDKEEDKRRAFSSIVALKVDEQRERDFFISTEEIKEENPEDENVKQNKGGSLDKTDGKLTLLQDWSECTLKCGGGLSYQQWMCVPPKNGGKPCPLPLVKQKECNIQACPINTKLDEEEDEKSKFKKAKIRIGPYSSRHNRYSKCIIKEGDAFRLEPEEENPHQINRLPSKMLMNNRTISIFEDDSYKKLVYSFNLTKTMLTPDPKEFCVMILKDNNMMMRIRGFDASCGNPPVDQFVEGWKKSFNTFKNECYQGRQEVLLDKDLQDKIDAMAKKKTELASMAAAAEKADEAKENFSSGESNIISGNIKNTEKLGLTAVNKEQQIENMIIAEEKEKQDLDLKKIQDQIGQENKRAESINVSIKEKELDDFVAMSTRQSESDLEEAKEEAKEKVAGQRYDMKEKILKMRKMAEAKKNQLLNKLKAAKTKLAKQVTNTMKAGSWETCVKGNIPAQKDTREAFCNKNFPDDYFLNLDCQDVENFCYSCCEKEFGQVHLDDRNDCYDKCDGPATLPGGQVVSPPKKVRWNWKQTSEKPKFGDKKQED